MRYDNKQVAEEIICHRWGTDEHRLNTGLPLYFICAPSVAKSLDFRASQAPWPPREMPITTECAVRGTAHDDFVTDEPKEYRMPELIFQTADPWLVVRFQG